CVLTHLCLIDPRTLGLRPLSLHDALPISGSDDASVGLDRALGRAVQPPHLDDLAVGHADVAVEGGPAGTVDDAAVLDEQIVAHRSEEHTSELQSRVDLVCRLLLEKKKKES